MHTSRSEVRNLAIFAAVALTATAAFHVPLTARDLDFSLAPSSPSLYLYLAGVAVPSVVALMLIERGARAAFLRSALNAKLPIRAYAWAIASQAAMIAAAWLLAYLSGSQLPTRLALAPSFALLAVGQIWVVLGEELGWRGFALPRLGARLGFRWATIALAIVWSVWHAPMFFVAGSLQQGTSPWLFAGSIYAWSAVHSRLYLAFRPSVVPNLAFHAGANITLNLGLVNAEIEPYLLGVYLVVGSALLLWLPHGANRTDESTEPPDAP